MSLADTSMEKSRPGHAPRPILAIDDEPNILASFELALLSEGFPNIITCSDARKVEGILNSTPVEAVLLDLAMPYISGEELLSMISEEHPGIPVIVVTGFNEVDKAVECMKKSAFDYIVKPVEAGTLASRLRKAVEHRALKTFSFSIQQEFQSPLLKRPEAFSAIKTQNPTMLSIFKYSEAIGVSSQCVLITGETGVGKELFARAIHEASAREGSLITVNVSGLDDAMFSDTLFGHEKGAFTSADRQRPGLIEKAAGGTLFLDEIGDLNPASQIKLLRLLQEQEYFPLGSDAARISTARIVTATCKDLDELQRQGIFRKDLYFRLQTHFIHIPPLRDRLKDDLALLTDYFLRSASEKLGKPPPTPPREILDILGTYDFPGNVRELESMIFDAVSRHEKKMLSLSSIKDHISRNRKGRNGAAALAEGTAASQTLHFPRPLPTIRDTTAALIEQALDMSGGNQTLAASMLGITTQALNQRLKRRDG